MYTELNKARQDLKKVLATLAQLEADFPEEFEKIKYTETTASGVWNERGPYILSLAQKSGQNTLKQIHKILYVLAKERKVNKPKKVKKDASTRTRRRKDISLRNN